MALSPCQRLAPRLIPLIGKAIPYSRLWKILSSIPHVYVEDDQHLYHVWHTRSMKGNLVVVEFFYGRTGLEISCVEPVIDSAVVKIKVV